MALPVVIPLAAKDKVPEPFVTNAWLAVPSADGSVHVTLDETVAGAWKATQLDESESANRKSLCAFRVTSELNMFVPENVFVPDNVAPPEETKVPATVRGSPDEPVWNSFK